MAESHGAHGASSDIIIIIIDIIMLASPFIIITREACLNAVDAAAASVRSGHNWNVSSGPT